tara:strand:+ start:74 stop:1072 length:999 start_codon:yes stop_codon:yes gene_type:complete
MNLHNIKQSLKLIFLSFCLITNANGHDIDVTGVARVLLYETSPGTYQMSIVDQQVTPLYNLDRVLPERCTVEDPSRFSYRFACQPMLNINDTITFPWTYEGVVVVAQWAEDQSVSRYFPGDGTFVDVPLSQLKAGASSIASLAVIYLELGVEHILLGVDHLLFVLGLLLLLSSFWTIIKTITAFTIAHSITLAFAVLGIFPVPNAPIEVLIALSIVFLAREVIMGHRGERTLVHSKPWIVAFIFGLFHGFGFAGALGEIGLSDSDIPMALLFFNLGVELGQVGFIIFLIALNAMLIKLTQNLVHSIHRGLAYGLGSIAMVWFMERLPALVVI